MQLRWLTASAACDLSVLPLDPTANRVGEAPQVGFESIDRGLIGFLRRFNLGGPPTQIHMMPFEVGQLFTCRISAGVQSPASPKRLQFAADCFEAAAEILLSLGVRHCSLP